MSIAPYIATSPKNSIRAVSIHCRFFFIMVNYRLFTAIQIPNQTTKQLERFQKGVPGAKWVDRDKFHITLAFYGDVNEEQAEMLDRELGNIRQPGFDVTLKGSGHFGRSDPHAIWAGVDDNPELTALHQKTKRAAQKIELPLEKREYTPHVTLAYLRRATELRRLVRFEKNMSGYVSRPFLVDQFVLISSWSRSTGSNDYVIEATYPLHA